MSKKVEYTGEVECCRGSKNHIESVELTMKRGLLHSFFIKLDNKHFLTDISKQLNDGKCVPNFTDYEFHLVIKKK